MKLKLGVNNCIQEDLIKETNSGYVIQYANHLHKMLEQLYEEFNKYVFIKCNSINFENYSRKYLVKELAEIIKNIPKKSIEIQ